MAGQFAYQVAIPHVAIPEIELWVEPLEPVELSLRGGQIELLGGRFFISTGNEPVYIWHAPDRQCVKRVTSRDILVIQPGEDLWFAFDFSGVLDNNSSSIGSLVYVQDSAGFLVSGSEVVAGTEVRFRLVAPSGTVESDESVEVAIIDTKNNRHISDGILRVRRGPM